MKGLYDQISEIIGVNGIDIRTPLPPTFKEPPSDIPVNTIIREYGRLIRQVGQNPVISIDDVPQDVIDNCTSGSSKLDYVIESVLGYTTVDTTSEILANLSLTYYCRIGKATIQSKGGSIVLCLSMQRNEELDTNINADLIQSLIELEQPC